MAEEVGHRMRMARLRSKLVRFWVRGVHGLRPFGEELVCMRYCGYRSSQRSKRPTCTASLFLCMLINFIAVRVRPPLKPDDPGYELVPQRFQRPMVHVMNPTSVAIDVPQGRKLFVFDRVFAETVDQDGVWDYLSESVGSFLQGYNVSILAYGQSGAGKSYTMGTSGPSEQHDPRSMGEFSHPTINRRKSVHTAYRDRNHSPRCPTSFRETGGATETESQQRYGPSYPFSILYQLYLQLREG